MLAQSVNHVTLDSYSPPYYSHLNFNPRPREEGDGFPLCLYSCNKYISIHALVKRATFTEGQFIFNKVISIHALVKRATYLNSYNRLPLAISIHALVKRATIFTLFHLAFKFHFNPRPREEGDSRKFTMNTKTKYFNPRPREEGDRKLLIRCQYVSRFQSTPS